ncbi:MAG: isoprenylcysteine carboxyl methyltransferase [Bacteroidetes bacterium]|nr:isoprenylcysteine carboxyl methyltransferase [Bacteroidota bacterium]
MTTLFIVVIGIVILQRLVELVISKKNEKWLLANGAIEYGASHYKYIVLLHTFFFISIIVEFIVFDRGKDLNILNYSFLVFFILLQLGRVWVLSSLGKYWNTKIFRIKDRQLIKKGPYKFLKHPNYVVVVLEIAVLPLTFNLYYTGIIFTILNALMLSVRIKEENKVLNI